MMSCNLQVIRTNYPTTISVTPIDFTDLKSAPPLVLEIRDAETDAVIARLDRSVVYAICKNPRERYKNGRKIIVLRFR